MDHCDECGFRYDSLPREELATTIRSLASRYAELLATPDDSLRAHPVPDTWSALEYACHIRDVFRVQRERVGLALAEHEPTFASMRREERVIEERYNEQPPARVAQEIRGSADAFADALDALDEEGWHRTGVYNWPTTQRRNVDWIARHTVHEGRHHVLDIERQVARAGKRDLAHECSFRPFS